VTTSQVLLGVGLIVTLAVGSQVLASRLRIPALIILLPAGFTAGAITTDVTTGERLFTGWMAPRGIIAAATASTFSAAAYLGAVTAYSSEPR
jgi:NhaP-type Na+/H+ or K+/H+ antiporter